MRHEIKHDASAPIWLTTMADMNNLLMIFFIFLFSMAVQDRKKYSRIAESIESMVGPRDAVASSASEFLISRAVWASSKLPG